MRKSISRLACSFPAVLALSLSTASRAQDACGGDFDGDGVVGGGDLAIMLGAWGPCGGCVADVDDTGNVDGADLSVLLGIWSGTCTPLDWATVLEFAPDPTVVTDQSLRTAITATGQPWRVRDDITQIEMLLIPPGTFNMGCSASNQWGCDRDETPVHAVTLTSPFYIGRYEVTQAQWTAKMGSNPSFFVTANGYSESDDRPVEMVSWTAIQGFLSATGLRLPTEAEWECAYRAGTATAFHSGPGFPVGTNDDALLASIAWYAENSGSHTHAVGGKAANALGLQDMSGNVWEWVNDWYSFIYYAMSPAADPPGPPTGTFRAARGGSWFATSSYQRSSNRGFLPADLASEFGGFRVARSP